MDIHCQVLWFEHYCESTKHTMSVAKQIFSHQTYDLLPLTYMTLFKYTAPPPGMEYTQTFPYTILFYILAITPLYQYQLSLNIAFTDTTFYVVSSLSIAVVTGYFIDDSTDDCHFLQLHCLIQVISVECLQVQCQQKYHILFYVAWKSCFLLVLSRFLQFLQKVFPSGV